MKSRCLKLRSEQGTELQNTLFEEALLRLSVEKEAGFTAFIEAWKARPSEEILEVWWRALHPNGLILRTWKGNISARALTGFANRLIHLRRTLGFFHYNAMLLLSLLATDWIAMLAFRSDCDSPS